MNGLSLNTASLLNAKKLDLSPRCSKETLQQYLNEEKGILVSCSPSMLSSKPDTWTWFIEYHTDDSIVIKEQNDTIFDSYNDSLDKGLYEALKLL